MEYLQMNSFYIEFNKVTVFIRRFYIPELHMTFSLLCHFIMPYERYPNKLIDVVLLNNSYGMSLEMMQYIE